MGLRVTVIVPTYNEQENIEALVTQLLALPTDVHVSLWMTTRPTVLAQSLTDWQLRAMDG